MKVYTNIKATLNLKTDSYDLSLFTKYFQWATTTDPTSKIVKEQFRKAEVIRVSSCGKYVQDRYWTSSVARTSMTMVGWKVLEGWWKRTTSTVQSQWQVKGADALPHVYNMPGHTLANISKLFVHDLHLQQLSTRQVVYYLIQSSIYINSMIFLN